MESARGEVEAYLDDVQDYKRCLAVRIEEANSDAEDVIDEWDSAVRQYNDS
jgi:cell division septum initiation protein DivIVA